MEIDLYPLYLFFRMNQNIPSGTSWKKILNIIYINSPHSYGESRKCPFNGDNHPLAKKLKITGYELMLGIGFLEDHKLIGRNVSGEGIDYSSNLYLTSKGFEVALNNENYNNQINILKSQYKTNELLTKATIILATVACIQILLYLISKRFSLSITNWWNGILITIIFIFALYLFCRILGIIIDMTFTKMDKKLIKFISGHQIN